MRVMLAEQSNDGWVAEAGQGTSQEYRIVPLSLPQWMDHTKHPLPNISHRPISARRVTRRIRCPEPINCGFGNRDIPKLTNHLGPVFGRELCCHNRHSPSGLLSPGPAINWFGGLWSKVLVFLFELDKDGTRRLSNTLGATAAL